MICDLLIFYDLCLTFLQIELILRYICWRLCFNEFFSVLMFKLFYTQKAFHPLCFLFDNSIYFNLIVFIKYYFWLSWLIFRLAMQICVTTSTSAGLEQILPWMFYHKVIGVTNFFLFVEGKAAKPEVSKILESIPVSRISIFNPSQYTIQFFWFISHSSFLFLNAIILIWFMFLTRV